MDLLLEVFALLGKVLGATCLQPGDAGLYPQTEYQCWCGAAGWDFADSAETTRPCAECGAVMHLTCAEYVRGRVLATNDVNATFDMGLCKVSYRALLHRHQNVIVSHTTVTRSIPNKLSRTTPSATCKSI